MTHELVLLKTELYDLLDRKEKLITSKNHIDQKIAQIKAIKKYEKMENISLEDALKLLDFKIKFDDKEKSLLQDARKTNKADMKIIEGLISKLLVKIQEY